MIQRRRIELQQAYVLHSRPYRNTSVIVEILTPDYGRTAVLARGARQIKSRWQGLLQPFQQLRLSWLSAGELGTLTAAEQQGRGAWLTGTLLASGFYVNELMMRLLHRDDPHPELFVYYDGLMRVLAGGADNDGRPRIERALRLFEKNALRELGYGLMLEHEAAGGRPVDAGAVYQYHPEYGPVRCHDAAQTAGVLLPGSSLLSLAADRLDDETSLRDAKHVMRQVLRHCLGGRPLKSRELFHVKY